ncbi:hypothetical protein FO488_16095 [Geobacter sp. FeAm09]|uniref:hypothetical protein n=1 Tax=Geobacter sp. FeAm09 TaxID=2597769 RepID=UPI0011F019C3|nr:hypothetical protein [Geobacter sp. FeAm09]QEM69528.1 hypothetical protein FO488_16095 [Geobacter sp. FeAm09]
MKVYQYNQETGVYAGELFEEDKMLKYVDGITTIAPPPYGPGQVPVFDPARRAWGVMPAAPLRRDPAPALGKQTVDTKGQWAIMKPCHPLQRGLPHVR